MICGVWYVVDDGDGEDKDMMWWGDVITAADTATRRSRRSEGLGKGKVGR